MLTVDPNRLDLVEEFRRAPMGDHSPDLQALLRVLRTEPEDGKHAVYCIVPYREWALARVRFGADGRRRIEVHWDVRYDSRETAEWDVFRRRWEAATGRTLGDLGPPPRRDRTDPRVLYGRM